MIASALTAAPFLALLAWIGWRNRPWPACARAATLAGVAVIAAGVIGGTR